jgi:hypothetical protein
MNFVCPKDKKKFFITNATLPTASYYDLMRFSKGSYRGLVFVVVVDVSGLKKSMSKNILNSA